MTSHEQQLKIMQDEINRLKQKVKESHAELNEQRRRFLQEIEYLKAQGRTGNWSD